MEEGAPGQEREADRDLTLRVNAFETMDYDVQKVGATDLMGKPMVERVALGAWRGYVWTSSRRSTLS